MNRRTISIAILIIVASCWVSWRDGWSSHADRVNAQAALKRDKAEKAIKPVEQKAAQAKDDSKVIYKTITRDVVKYVQSPNRTVCKFDDASIQLRQRSIDAANSISGFDADTMQSK
ncbi:hypothetical protein [Serratia fonticola]|uniref:Lipoprotein n=1 Tax=Serratia fonticola TaxID=47917 RepID=A0A3S4Y759_SERFO|nr:Uncharacterised protein [Serratia fonticola]